MANRQGNARPTKADRKEQARRERVELQRKMARSQRNRRIALVLALLVAAVAGVLALTRSETATADPQVLLDRATEASAAAGCSEVENVGPYQPEGQDQAHVALEEQPPLSSYTSIPPASGPHNAATLGAGVYDSAPDIGRLLHSLEHGAAVVWYSADAPPARLDRIRAFYEDGDVGSRVIVAPYDYPDQGAAGSLPVGAEMALVAWHHVETCARADLAAAFGFTARYAAPPFGGQEYLGEAPEAGIAM
jgi:hypothetical protein